MNHLIMMHCIDQAVMTCPGLLYTSKVTWNVCHLNFFAGIAYSKCLHYQIPCIVCTCSHDDCNVKVIFLNIQICLF